MFDSIASVSDDADQMFRQAAKQLVESGRFHQLFDLRLIQKRHELGMPLSQETTLDELEGSLRMQLEDAYLDACREIGQLLLEAGKTREAWAYLRPAGDKQPVRRWLERAVPDAESADELIALALHEGIDPERGFAWLLAHRGTCNAITELEGVCGSLPLKDQVACATVLVRHLHQELLSNLHGHLARLEPEAPALPLIREMIDTYPSLLEEGGYHIDTSHLATTVRFGRLLTEPIHLRLAVALADYGNRLAQELRYPDNPPFEDTYPAHLLLFRATLGEEVQQAVDYFSQKARALEIEEHGTGAVEAYLILLERVGRADLALEEYAALVPENCALSPYAPTFLRLAQASGLWDRYLEICRQRNDVVGFAAGQIGQKSS